jgi:S1-C subfamily serine protease
VAWARPAKKSSGGLLAPASGWAEWHVTPKATSTSKTGKVLDTRELFKVLSPSVFQVEASLSSGTSQGSAVAVDKTELLTNCHVVEGAQKIKLKQNKKEWAAELTRSDPATDRCVLTVANAAFTPVLGVRGYDDLEVGEPLYTLGSPNGLELSMSNGILSGLRAEDGRRFVQTTAPISPGSSGGGLFDARGYVVGITTLVLVGREHLNQSLNFAIPADSFWQP